MNDNLKKFFFATACFGWLVATDSRLPAAELDNVEISKNVKSNFEKHCFDCHSGASEEGGFSFDKLVGGQYEEGTHAKWEAVWRNVRAQTMPPAESEMPSTGERTAWVNWIQKDIFKLDPHKIDPGHTVVRRLNRSEYRETIKTLTGVDFDVKEEFPADDTGYGFDTIGEVLSLSPVLIEKYLAAASQIVGKFAPLDGPQPPEKSYWTNQWKIGAIDGKEAQSVKFDQDVSLYHRHKIDKANRYRVRILWSLENAWSYTPQEASLKFSVLNEDGSPKLLGEKTLNFSSGQEGKLESEVDLPAGDVTLLVEFKSINSDDTTNNESARKLPYKFILRRAVFAGPLDGSIVEYPEKSRKIFFNGPPPQLKEGQDRLAPAYRLVLREHMKPVIKKFGDDAFRRPIDEATLERLCDIADSISREPNKQYEDGVASALQLILASPRFLFRIEQTNEAAPNGSGATELVARLDDYSLASRLSYFLWGGPPDAELLKLASEGKLYDNLESQLDRMIAQDWRMHYGLGNFIGQWLQTRDVQESQVDVKRILAIRDDEEANRVFNWEVRQAMTDETLKLYQYLLAEGRPAEELLNAKYTFLNEKLANFYGIPDVKGNQMRKVDLGPDSHRRGVLTHGSILVVTSNPTRTSPVKRGLFVLENFLGTPAPPAPPNVPALEESKSGNLKDASLRQILEFHRRDAACAACHQRMDPLGLAMENYNALGQWRTEEKGRPAFRDRPAEPNQPIDPSGKLMTGESFSSVVELAEILAEKRRDDYYRCLTEKVMTFALGRGMNYQDTTAIDQIVDRVKNDNGSLKTLYKAVITSIPFTHCRSQKTDPTLASKNLE